LHDDKTPAIDQVTERDYQKQPERITNLTDRYDNADLARGHTEIAGHFVEQGLSIVYVGNTQRAGCGHQGGEGSRQTFHMIGPGRLFDAGCGY
jgi:hypothetical protein